MCGLLLLLTLWQREPALSPGDYRGKIQHWLLLPCISLSLFLLYDCALPLDKAFLKDTECKLHFQQQFVLVQQQIIFVATRHKVVQQGYCVSSNLRRVFESRRTPRFSLVVIWSPKTILMSTCHFRGTVWMFCPGCSDLFHECCNNTGNIWQIW